MKAEIAVRRQFRERQLQRDQRDQENRLFLTAVEAADRIGATTMRNLGFVDSNRRTEGTRIDGLPLEETVASLRRNRRTRAEDPVSVITLVEDDSGVLRWHVGPGFSASLTGRRRGRGGPGIVGTPVQSYKFVDLPPNLIGQRLIELDNWLTPDQGLFQVNVQKMDLGAPAAPIAQGRILLLIHGTFSHSRNIIQGFANLHGKAFLKQASGHYDQVLAFGHPTLSVSPVINACDLARHFRDCSAEVDVICHSRGGVVARWWREAFAPANMGRGKTIFVGSPLAGTNLAAPARLKAVLEMLANISRRLSQLSGVAAWASPWATALFTASKTLMQIVATITGGLAKMPVLDAGIALIPGLEGQSRHGANRELLCLRDHVSGIPATYFAVRANFEPEDVGWAFWKKFRDPKLRLFDRAADAVFPGANDLVVDSDSMLDLADNMFLPANQILDFEQLAGFSSKVHHLNYFDFTETVDFFHSKLGVPK